MMTKYGETNIDFGVWYINERGEECCETISERCLNEDILGAGLKVLRVMLCCRQRDALGFTDD